MMTKDIIPLLSKSFLFVGLEDAELAEACDALPYVTKTFSAGDEIYTPTKFSNDIGIVIDGECLVERVKSDGSHLPLNTLAVCDSFGILAAFSCDVCYPTLVKAKKKSEVLFITRECLENLILHNPKIALNVIRFMGDRIAFLNDKIATFSADNVEQKLAKQLLLISKNQDDTPFSLNCKRTAEIINSGRASLYRALSSLEEKELIGFVNKKVYIKDPAGLERISK